MNPEDVDYVPTIVKDRKRRVNVVKVNEDREERLVKYGAPRTCSKNATNWKRLERLPKLY